MQIPISWKKENPYFCAQASTNSLTAVWRSSQQKARQYFRELAKSAL
jgi:hypothetical protein